MSLNGTAAIVGAYEHPTRLAEGLSVLRLHADVARGALADAGLDKSDVDAYFCAGDAQGFLHLRSQRRQAIFLRVAAQIGQHIKNPVVAHESPAGAALGSQWLIVNQP